MTQDKNILIHNIYYMLAYAYRNFRVSMFEEINGEYFEDIHNLFAEILIRGVGGQLKQGLYRTYVNREGPLPAIRGKIDLLKTRSLQYTIPCRAYCIYDEISENNIYNQILKVTLKYLLNHPKVDKSQKDSIRNILRYFGSIDSVDMTSFSLNQFCFDRNNQNYQFLVNICFFIYEDLLMTTEVGKSRLRTLKNGHMERLFEKFVLEYYRKHYPELRPHAEQIEWNINMKESTISIIPRMQTDVLLTIGERNLIIDTKYYSDSLQHNFETNKIHSEHLAQVYAYVNEYDKRKRGMVDGMLLYAKTEQEIVPDGQMKFTTGNTIYFRTLDLNKDFQEIKKQLNSFITIDQWSNI